MGDDQLQDTSGASQTASPSAQPVSLADPGSSSESASTDPNRPVSTILADSQPETTAPLADPATDYTVPVPVSDYPSVATESATVAPLPDLIPVEVLSQPPADSPTSPPMSPQSPLSPISSPVDPSVPPIPSDPPAPSSPPNPTEGGSILDSSPPNQPIQVQPEVPVSAPSPEASQVQEIPSESAGIKPEPPEGTQPAPLADSDSQKSSFGDILGGIGETPAPVTPVSVPIQPPSPSSTVPIPSVPPTSFGDLGTKPPIEEPTINIEPIEPPKPTQQPQPPQSPLTPQPITEVVTEAKADFSSKRQQALQTRRKNRDEHLAKILSLVSQKGKIHNNDVCSLLRVSQSTATNYLHSLVKDGKIKKEGKAKATSYSL